MAKNKTKISNKNSMVSKKVISSKIKEETRDTPACPHCGGEIYSFGKENKKTWYSCKECGRKSLL
jgi:tRNA(Ile2) C34 agmatinyltransferase TiaS